MFAAGAAVLRALQRLALVVALTVATLAAALGPAAPARAQELVAVPPLTARVIDQTGTLRADEAAALEAKLAAFEAESGPQIVILMLPSTAPEDIAAFAQRAGETWKLGRREVGDGLLIVVALADRRVNLQVAKALEGAVPDLAARQIIDRALKPAFRAGDYAGGLDAALDMVFARLRGEALPAPGSGPAAHRTDGLDWEAMAMFFFIGVPVVASVLTAMMGRKLGALVTAAVAGGIGWSMTASVLLALLLGTGALLLVGLFGIGAAARSVLRGGGSSGHGGGPPIIWGGGGSHDDWGSGSSWGGGGGGGGFGGFSSGGGGDFGGGGASGDW